MNELPDGWERMPLGDIIQVRNGYAFKSADFTSAGVPLIRQSNLTGQNVDLTKCVYVPKHIADANSAFSVRKGDILIGMSGSIGEPSVYQGDTPALQNQRTGLIIFRANKTAHRDFIRYFLIFSEREFAQKGKGIGVQNVSASDIESIPAPLPSLPEQRRIVAKLDNLFRRSNNAREELVRIPRLIERYRQGVLEFAFSGMLTAKWRKRSPDCHTGGNLLKEIRATRMARATTTKDRAQIERAFENGNMFPREDELGAGIDLPDSWTSCRIGAIGTVCNGSTPSRGHAKYWAGSIPWVSSGEVRNNVIAETREAITRAGYENSSVKLLPKGTVLLAMIGEGKTRGQSAILGIEATINQNIAAIVIDHGMVIPEFLWRWFQLQYEQTRRRGAGNGPKALNCQAVRDLPFVLPPVEEQREIVSTLNASFSIIETSEAEANRAVLLLDRLDQATLAKAFRGDLVSSESRRHNE